MDLNHLLIWTVGAGCGLMLLQVLGQKHARQLVLLPASILAVLGICYWIAPDSAGFVSGVLFFLLLLAPAWGGALLNSLLMKKRYRTARSVAIIMAGLRPDRESRQLPTMIQAMRMMQTGQGHRAVALLQKLMSFDGPLSRMARILLTRYEGSWIEFLDWANAPANRPAVLSDPNLYDTTLQALGETGQRAELLKQYEQIQSGSQYLPAHVLNVIRMKIAAFCGDDFIVAQLCSGPLRELPADSKRFWMATSLQVAGRKEEAARDFRWLLTQSEAGMARSAQRRLDTPLPNLQEFPLEEWQQQQTLQRISRAAEWGIQHGTVRFSRSRTCWATWSLATVLMLVFLCEIPGGSENFENLERMGAMLIPALPGGGEWWRMVAAAFLHFGPTHLIMNLLGLIILGRRLEMTWGSWLTLLTYLASAIGSIGLAPLFIAMSNLQEQTVLVGASGGVMGLLGGLLVQSLFELIRGRSLPGNREFISLLLIAVIQMTFDANTPNVSSEAHLLGLTIGILFGSVWNLVWWIRDRRS